MSKRYDQNCPVAKALDLVGDRWTLLIVRDLLDEETRRFQDFQQSLKGIAPAILSALFTIMVATQVVSSGFYPTYHMSRSLSEQTEPVNVGKIGLVYLDEDTRKFVLDIGHAAETCSIAPGRPFVGLYDIPGVALIIQGIPVLTPWLGQPPQAEAWLKRAPDATLQSAIVGLRAFGDGEFPKMPGVLPSFPVGYRLCGEGVFPDWKQRIQLWAPDR